MYYFYYFIFLYKKQKALEKEVETDLKKTFEEKREEKVNLIVDEEKLFESEIKFKPEEENENV